MVLTGQGRGRQALDPEGAQGLLQLADKVTALSHLFTVFAALPLATIVARIQAMQTGPRDSSAAFAARAIGVPPSDRPSIADAPARPSLGTAMGSGANQTDYEARFSIIVGCVYLPIGVLMLIPLADGLPIEMRDAGSWIRSEEHTSELQSLMRISSAVFC